MSTSNANVGAGGLRQGHPGPDARAGLRPGRQAEGVVAALAGARAADAADQPTVARGAAAWHCH